MSFSAISPTSLFFSLHAHRETTRSLSLWVHPGLYRSLLQHFTCIVHSHTLWRRKPCKVPTLKQLGVTCLSRGNDTDSGHSGGARVQTGNHVLVNIHPVTLYPWAMPPSNLVMSLLSSVPMGPHASIRSERNNNKRHVTCIKNEWGGWSLPTIGREQLAVRFVYVCQRPKGWVKPPWNLTAKQTVTG